MRILVSTLLSLITLASLQAQKRAAVNSLDTSVGAANFQAAFSLSGLHTWNFGAKDRFGVGAGLRLTSYFGQNQYYETAPAQITSGNTGPQVIFQDNLTKNIDTLLVQSPQVNALNLYIEFQYAISRRWRAGFNIDIVGVSAGGSRTANYINGTAGNVTAARPSPWNLLLVSDNDLGTLNSEFYLHRTLNDRWGVKGGAQFLFTEYTTSTPVQQYPEANDRFRKKSLMISIGVTYKF